MKVTLELQVFLSASALAAAPAFAHHSMAEFDRGSVVELDGEVVAVAWRNPHILLDVETTDAAGATAVWNLEGSAVSAQRRHGVEGGLVEVGDRVRVAGWPSNRRVNHMLVNHVLLPEGVELLVGTVREPRWSTRSVGSESLVIDPDKAAVAEGRGLFRVWTRGTPAWYFAGGASYRLTPEAETAQGRYDDLRDNPLRRCTPPGMPALIGNPYPMEFVERGGNVELHFEEFDVVRTFHIAAAADPTTVPLSPLGYTVARWEGETLAARTTRIDWPFFNRVGAPQSRDVVVDERFTPADNGNRLDYVMTVTDPATLVEPFVWEAHWTWEPGEEVGRYDCTVGTY